MTSSKPATPIDRTVHKSYDKTIKNTDIRDDHAAEIKQHYATPQHFQFEETLVLICNPC